MKFPSKVKKRFVEYFGARKPIVLRAPIHTPGPWTAQYSSIDDEWDVKKLDLEICVQASEIDAHLMAAGPEMLRALEIAKIYVSRHSYAAEVLQEIERAIFKAKGGV